MSIFINCRSRKMNCTDANRFYQLRFDYRQDKWFFIHGKSIGGFTIQLGIFNGRKRMKICVGFSVIINLSNILFLTLRLLIFFSQFIRHCRNYLKKKKRFRV